MNSQTEEAVAGSGKFDSLLLGVAVVLLLGGMFAFYYFTAQLNLLERALILLAGTVAALVVAYQTQMGKTLVEYARGSRVELRKVVWPTRQESIQTTLMIAVFVLIAALFFAGVDWLLNLGVHKLVSKS
jgi:preprotein translocase subunit SecE